MMPWIGECCLQDCYHLCHSFNNNTCDIRSVCFRTHVNKPSRAKRSNSNWWCSCLLFTLYFGDIIREAMLFSTNPRTRNEFSLAFGENNNYMWLAKYGHYGKQLWNFGSSRVARISLASTTSNNETLKCIIAATPSPYTSRCHTTFAEHRVTPFIFLLLPLSCGKPSDRRGNAVRRNYDFV